MLHKAAQCLTCDHKVGTVTLGSRLLQARQVACPQRSQELHRVVGHVEVASGAAGSALQQPEQQGQRARHAHEQLGVDRARRCVATCTLPAGEPAHGGISRALGQ